MSAASRSDAWEVQVTDEGPGIPADVFPRVFDEGFTTKTEPFNAGLGLPVARFLVDGMGGTLSVANRPQGGAGATIVLPGRTSPR